MRDRPGHLVRGRSAAFLHAVTGAGSGVREAGCGKRGAGFGTRGSGSGKRGKRAGAARGRGGEGVRVEEIRRWPSCNFRLHPHLNLRFVATRTLGRVRSCPPSRVWCHLSREWRNHSSVRPAYSRVWTRYLSLGGVRPRGGRVAAYFGAGHSFIFPQHSSVGTHRCLPGRAIRA